MGKREGLDERSTHLYEQRRAVGAAEAAQCAPCPQVGKHGDLLRVRVLLGTAVIVAFAFLYLTLRFGDSPALRSRSTCTDPSQKVDSPLTYFRHGGPRLVPNISEPHLLTNASPTYLVAIAVGRMARDAIVDEKSSTASTKIVLPSSHCSGARGRYRTSSLSVALRGLLGPLN